MGTATVLELYLCTPRFTTPNEGSAGAAAVFSPRISPSSAVPSLVGMVMGTPVAVLITVATERIPPNAFNASMMVPETSVGTVYPPCASVPVLMVLRTAAQSSGVRACGPFRIHLS